MKNSGLDEKAFQALGSEVSGAFLAVSDATTEIREQYATVGLVGDPSGLSVRRVVRVVSLPTGTRLFKRSDDDEALAAHFGVGAEEMDPLRRQSARVRK